MTNITCMTSGVFDIVDECYGLNSPSACINNISWILRKKDVLSSEDKRALGITACHIFLHQYDDFRSQDRDAAIAAITPTRCNECGELIPYDFVAIEDASEEMINCAIICPYCLSTDHFDIPLETEVHNG